jgi:hypothetical protein
VSADLRSFLRAAGRRQGDPEAIFETAAANGFTPAQLVRVVDRLRETHPDWRPAKRDRDPLIDDLLAAGKSRTWIAERIGCHPRTVARRAATSRPPTTDRMIKRSEVDKTRVRVSFPILSFDASSGAALTKAHQRELLAALGETAP